MTSTTSWDRKEFFALLRWQLRRCLPVTLLYAAALLFLSFATEHTVIMTVPVIAFSAAAPLLLLGECLNRRQADMLHALPFRRGAWYAAALITGLISLWIPLFPALLLHQFLYHLSSWLLTSVSCLVLGAASFLFFSMIAAGSSGWFSYVLNAFLLSACWPLGASYFLSLVAHTLPVGSLPTLLEKFLVQAASPPLALFYSGIATPELWKLAWWACGSLILAFLGRALYRRRESENTGAFRTCKPLELATRIEAALLAVNFIGCAAESIVSHPIKTEGDWESPETLRFFYFDAAGIPLVLGSMALALLLAWLFTELLYHRGVKGMKKHLSALLAPLVITVCALGAVSTGLGLDAPMNSKELSAVRLENGMIFQWNSYSMGYAPVLVQDSSSSWSNGENGTYYNNLQTAVYSPELLHKVEQLQEKWIELERANQYPYLPGRKAYEPSDVFGLTFFGPQGYVGNWNCTYQGRHTEQTKALYEECDALAKEIAASSELISGLTPVSAIDALSSIEKIELDPAEEKKKTELLHYEKTEISIYALNYDTQEPGKNAVSISSLPKSFSDRLEAALRDDLAHNRFQTYDDLRQFGKGKTPLSVYELRYAYGKPFTARGGVLLDNATPAEGETLQLYSEYATAWVLRVWPQMTKTYALLESTLAE